MKSSSFGRSPVTDSAKVFAVVTLTLLSKISPIAKLYSHLMLKTGLSEFDHLDFLKSAGILRPFEFVVRFLAKRT